MIEAFQQVGPVYNLVLVVVAFVLFVRLFRTEGHIDVYLTPWKLVFAGVCIFVLETLITIVSLQVSVETNFFTRHFNGFLELGIVTLFLYALLLQREQLKSGTNI